MHHPICEYDVAAVPKKDTLDCRVTQPFGSLKVLQVQDLLPCQKGVTALIAKAR